MTSTVFAMPAAIYACAVLYPKRKPAHAALISNAAAFTAFIFFCTSHAVQGSITSEEIVETKIKSTSSAAMPLCSSAFWAASVAIETVVSSLIIRRLATPVRSRIQVSFVSTIFARSSLLTIRFGRLEPVPYIFPIIYILHIN